MRVKTIQGLILVFMMILFFHSGCEKKEIITIYETPSHETLVFLTDFDKNSDVVIAMIASLKTSFPDLQIECIQAKPFNIKEAAYQLEVAASDFPEGTYFMGIVDPGLISTGMVFEAQGGKKFVVPDNGLATRVIKYMNTWDYYRIENPLDESGQDPSELNFTEFYLKSISAVISGKPLSLFGPEIDQPVVYPIQDPEKNNDTISGEVIFTDNFGNCITNIPDSLINSYDYGALFKITGNSFSFFASYGINYASVPENQNVMLVDRLKRLEMAVDLGDLSQRYQLNAGSSIKLFPSKVHIGILLFNNTTTPFVDTMKNMLSTNGFNEDVNTVIVGRNANGNIEQFNELIQELIGEKIDILISFSTQATQAAVTMLPDSIPIVFSLVTDPESAGVLNQRLRVTGLSDATDCFQFISFTRRILPELSIAGSIYNSQEANSVYVQQKLHDQLLFQGIDYINATVTNVDDIPSAYEEIKAYNIEVILITNDNTMTLATADLVALATPDTIPVLGTDHNNVKNGALAAIGVDYDLIARETGKLAIAIIRGVNPDEVPVHYFETNTISLNTQTAASLGYMFDPGLLEEAKYIFP